MLKLTIILCIVAAGIALALLGRKRENQRMRRYWDRTPTNDLWRQAFPAATDAQIARFLDQFVDAFGYDTSRRFCFAPDDRIMDIYWARYSKHDVADMLELETFAMDLHQTYKLRIRENWREDITLAELFALILTPQWSPRVLPHPDVPDHPCYEQQI